MKKYFILLPLSLLPFQQRHFFWVYKQSRAFQISGGLADGASVISAAISVGFAGPSYFSTTFKRIMGIPPKQYSSTLVQPHSAEKQI